MTMPHEVQGFVVPAERILKDVEGFTKLLTMNLPQNTVERAWRGILVQYMNCSEPEKCERAVQRITAYYQKYAA